MKKEIPAADLLCYVYKENLYIYHGDVLIIKIEGFTDKHITKEYILNILLEAGYIII